MRKEHAFRFIRRTGQWLFVPGSMALTALPFCLGEDQKALLFAFGGTAGLNILLAGLCSCLPVKGKLERRRAMCSVAAGWFLVAVMCGVPLYVSANLMGTASEVAASYGTPIDALFEGMSGITSCGLTLSERPDQLPQAIQWWRSVCEWVGGVGVVMLMFLLLEPESQEDAFYRAEARSWILEDGLSKTVFHIWVIYAGLTLLSISSIRLTGTSWWEAVNHGLTAISTGGFTIRKDSFQSTTMLTQAVAIFLMILGGISFRTYHHILNQPKKKWAFSTQFRGYLMLLLLGGTGLLTLMWLGEQSFEPVRVLFQWVSALGTCGFSSLDLSTWGSHTLFFLVIAMSIGGCAGSTTGGFKISRLAWMAAFLRRQISEKVLNRESSEPYSFDHHPVEPADADKRIHHAQILIGLWAVTLVVAWVVLQQLMPAHDPMHLLFEAASALGSVGLTTGVTDVGMPDEAKFSLILLMWLGRLEFVSILLLSKKAISGKLSSTT